MHLFLVSALSSSLYAQASPQGCSACGGYGSPFGPGEGYSYACYYVQHEGGIAQAFRFEDFETCRAARNGNPGCSANEIRSPRGESLCWHM